MITCINCSAELAEHDTFCEKCGMRIIKRKQKYESIPTLDPESKQFEFKTLKTVITDSSIYYYTSFCLDILLIGLLVALLESYGSVQNGIYVPNSGRIFWDLLLLVIIESATQIAIFKTIFGSYKELNKDNYLAIYLFIPTLHLIPLILVTAMTLNNPILSSALFIIIIFQILTGIIHFYVRYSNYLNI